MENLKTMEVKLKRLGTRYRNFSYLYGPIKVTNEKITFGQWDYDSCYMSEILETENSELGYNIIKNYLLRKDNWGWYLALNTHDSEKKFKKACKFLEDNKDKFIVTKGEYKPLYNRIHGN